MALFHLPHHRQGTAYRLRNTVSILYFAHLSISLPRFQRTILCFVWRIIKWSLLLDIPDVERLPVRPSFALLHS